MNLNPYSPPQTALDQSSFEGGNSSAPEFYVVSRRKFFLLFYLTLGFYDYYWFYRNWAIYKARTGESIWPVMRGLFPIFFVWSLFASVDRSLKRGQRTHFFNHARLGSVYVVASVIGHTCNKLSDKNIGSPYTDWIPLLVFITLGYTLWQAQKAINIACNDPQGESNSRLSWANYGWMGGTLLIVALTLYAIVSGVAD
ncbi:hypothetical protein GCM10007907_22010 [Chitinimonas prasina]|uniref:DUF4234 domain-containing protein n=1 Tax=Chitinimonas prasina TaxID=1434937 RepID=A0ABQ5YJE7_9NEIS|nr:hypothetical protein [Chitinimonas prasina]GLR13411.1 hypothetical protein GCM10007907_22010 [Chitinimonas prasina]